MELVQPTTPLPYCDDFPVPIVVRNTFINAVIERSPSLQRFVRERRSSSCPLSSGGGGCGGAPRLSSLAGSQGSASPQTAPARPHRYHGSAGDRHFAPAERLAAAVSAAALTGIKAPAESHDGGGNQCVKPLRTDRVVCGPPVGLIIPKQPSRHRARHPSHLLASGGLYGEAAGAIISGGADADGNVGMSCAPGVPTAVQVPTEPRAKPRAPAAAAISASGLAHMMRTGQEPSAVVTAPAGVSAERPHWRSAREEAEDEEEAADAWDMPVPSLGSASHHLGKCRPCVFVHKKGCSNGYDCLFCHICQPGEKQRRKRDRWEKMRDKWSSKRTTTERSLWEE